MAEKHTNECNGNSNGSSNGQAPSRSTKLILVKDSPIQGKGVFAAKRIRKGQRIIEYVGERIHPSEEGNRYDDASMERHHTFLFAVDENTTIDAAVGGSDAMYINHSCDPNCEAVDYDGRIWIEAIRNIQPGQELTYDYNYQTDEPIDDEDRRLYVCKCGSPRCRGLILRYTPPKKKRR